MRGFRTIRHHAGGRHLLHVETDHGIVNVYVGIHDARGRSVTTIEIIPDRYAGEPKVMMRKVLLRGASVVRLVQAKRARNGRG